MSKLTTTDTSGFFTFDGTDGFFAPNAVYTKTYTLLRTDRKNYQYPVHEWHWFDSLEAAQAHYDTRYNWGMVEQQITGGRV